MIKNIIILLLLVIMMPFVMAVPDCSDYGYSQLQTCYGSTLFDDLYWWMCYQNDYNIDGTVNLIDVSYYSQYCYEPIVYNQYVTSPKSLYMSTPY